MRGSAEVDRTRGSLAQTAASPRSVGWLKDKFGLSWQIVPRRLPELVNAGAILQQLAGVKVHQWCEQEGPRSGAFLL
jgi:predicted 3-demethylubiquinone-9 3-methyltransferase (glyoxalase superfamily)